MQSQKQQNDLCSFPRQTIEYHSNPSLCPTSNTEEAEVKWFYKDLQDLLELTPKKDILFIIGDWNAKARSRDPWSNRQIWSWSTKWSRAKANRVLPTEALVIANILFQQHKRGLYTWTSPSGRYWLIICFCSQRWRSFIQSETTRLGTDCGSDHELLIAQFRLKLKKVGKTTRPFRYDLNQIPYDYSVEVRNSFKRLDLVDRLCEELWTEVHTTV